MYPLNRYQVFANFEGPPRTTHTHKQGREHDQQQEE